MVNLTNRTKTNECAAVWLLTSLFGVYGKAVFSVQERTADPRGFILPSLQCVGSYRQGAAECLGEREVSACGH